MWINTIWDAVWNRVKRVRVWFRASARVRVNDRVTISIRVILESGIGFP